MGRNLQALFDFKGDNFEESFDLNFTVRRGRRREEESWGGEIYWFWGKVLTHAFTVPIFTYTYELLI